MRYTLGVFKENYRGHGIYWAGTYNVDGDGEYKTILAVRSAVDELITQREARVKIENDEKAATGQYLICRKYKEGDEWKATCETPEGVLDMGIGAFRRILFDLEDQYEKEVLWV